MEKQIVKYIALDNLKKAYKLYGLEGTEQKVRELFKGKIKEYMLELHYKNIGRGVNNGTKKS